ncbi:hypothetical protein J7J47_03680 [Halomonas sp. ISL-60]|uniref:hypothetical protein n=1 Tax=Halomonas sp. ISL-56 TaxID=2819149 RepID=UPI001BECD48F|nr:hypothetical protein [Halomonas sp. ISL-56]MBT2771330.1 hypothetical protein [Halomonas sp. ISL-60]MBT2800687.1 hypothetical protein [Halomonas sp. ISL-56]
MNNIITKKEAKAQGLKRYYTGKPCKRGHVAERLVNNRSCVECDKERWNDYRRDNAGKIKDYRRDNAEKAKKYAKEYYRDNVDRIKGNMKDYQKENAAKFNFHSKNFQLKERTLGGRYNENILKYYEESNRLTQETGIQHNVDHIVPLNGEKVSGLHVHWNLRVVTEKDNKIKSNKIIEELVND